MVNAGMDVKVLQYLMGHSEADVTLNIYAHMGYDRVAAQMIRLIDGGKDERTNAAGEAWYSHCNPG